MNDVHLIAFFLRLILALSCFAFSGALAYRKQEGWGWFLFVGFLLVPALVVGP